MPVAALHQKLHLLQALMTFLLSTVLSMQCDCDVGVCCFWQSDQEQIFCYLLQNLQAIYISY